MKTFKLLATITVAASTLFFVSCNSGSEKKANETTVAADTTTAKTPEPAPEPAAKPSNILVVKHKVANYAKWKIIYDSHDSVRLAYGLHNYVVARGADDSNMVMVALKMDDVAKAKAFTALADLKATMQKGGVIGAPSFNYMDVQMMDTSTNAEKLRVMLSHKVKDWDAWKKEFDSHKQVRMDAGLTDRVVGFSVDDNHMVTVVCAVSDKQKAKAFFSSKDLKDKMAAAGVEGPMTIFYFTIAQKY
jgi:hypothetical protein